MADSFSCTLWHLFGSVLIGFGMVVTAGCDTVPAPKRDQQRPTVANLQIIPDSVHESELSDEQIEDSLAQVEVDVSARAADPDGTVERVVFVFEPSSNPRGTITGTLPALSEDRRYGGPLGLSVPLVDEIYTIRVFAVDDDSLSSNQVTGQFRFVPTDTSAATRGAIRVQMNRRPADS